MLYYIRIKILESSQKSGKVGWKTPKAPLTEPPCMNVRRDTLVCVSWNLWSINVWCNKKDSKHSRVSLLNLLFSLLHQILLLIWWGRVEYSDFSFPIEIGYMPKVYKVIPKVPICTSGPVAGISCWSPASCRIQLQ